MEALSRLIRSMSLMLYQMAFTTRQYGVG